MHWKSIATPMENLLKGKKIIVHDGTKRHFKTSDIAVLTKILLDLLALLGFETS